MIKNSERWNKSSQKEKILEYCRIVKVLFFSALVVGVWMKMGFKYAIFCGSELILISAVANELKSTKVKYIIRSVGELCIGVQMFLLIYGRVYLNLVMVTNLGLLEDISGNAILYIGSAIVLIVMAFLPSKEKKYIHFWNKILLVSMAIIEVVLFLILGNSFSPIYAYGELVKQQYAQIKLKKKIIEMGGEAADDFFHQNVDDFYKKPEELPENPNIVIIFTEGLSQNIVDDERNIMPNVRKYQQKALTFDGYYNHTFATFRGLIGQLYSGYQMDNYDTNQLVSLQDILNIKGYSTTFINVEPNNELFTTYLSNMEFEYLEGERQEAIHGEAHTISDKDAYEKLYSVMEARGEDGKPFMISMYTFGSHATLDSKDEKYGDGSVAELNKFYNVDYQFGEFMRKFEKSKFAKNTILVFTADHCAYLDDEFYNAFPNWKRDSWGVDQIPLFIYYDGIEHKVIDVDGCNSLDFTPTICDYLDISSENYFLGISLFADTETKSEYDTIFHQGQDYISTKGNIISEISGPEKNDLKKEIAKYYSICQKRQ